MRLFRNIPITFENKAYEIRVYYSDTLINIVSFLNNHPANCLRHQIQIPKKCNVEAVLKQEILNELIEMAQHDITTNRGKRLSGILRENMIIEKPLDL